MKRVLFLVIVAISALAIQAPVDAETAAGLVVTAAGDVIVRRGESLPVTASFELLVGDTLVLAVGSRCEIRTGDGIDTLEGPLQRILEGDEDDGGIGSWVSKQLNQWLGKPRAGDFRSRGLGDAVARASNAILIVAPSRAGTFPHSSVRSDAVIRWEPLDGVDNYEVVIVTEESQSTHAVENATHLATTLAPGKRYACMVLAGDNAGKSKWCEFSVLNEADEASLNAALEGKSDVDAGTILMFVGLYNEAIDRFTLAIESGADASSALHWRSLAYESIGLTDYAEKDRDMTMSGGG